MYAYSNNGLSFRAVDSNYVAQSGEVLFPAIATPAQLSTAFSGYTSAIETMAAPAAGQAVLAQGIAITSTSTPALNGTYALTSGAQSAIMAIMLSIIALGTFPNGALTYTYMDASGTPHIFPSITEFKAFAAAFAAYYGEVVQYIDSAGAAGSIPSSNAVTIT